MTRRRQNLLSIVLVPVLLLVLVVIHEEGHTIISRWFGDSAATFSLIEIRPNGSFCLGCNTFDHTKLSYLGRVIVSLAGLLFSQAIAIGALIMARRIREGSLVLPLLKTTIVVFAFLDVALQVLQALVIDLSRRTYPTNTDLTDFMLLVSSATGANQGILKFMLVVVSGVYLFVIYRLGFFRKVGRKPQVL